MTRLGNYEWGLATAALAWQLALRIAVGGYWLFFASQRWLDWSWTEGLISIASRKNYVPLYGEVLRTVVAPNWGETTILITTIETAVGSMILLGLFLRFAGLVGALTDLNLLLTFGFCECPWNETEFPLVFWFYFAPMLLNIQVALDKSHSVLGLQRFINKTKTGPAV